MLLYYISAFYTTLYYIILQYITLQAEQYRLYYAMSYYDYDYDYDYYVCIYLSLYIYKYIYIYIYIYVYVYYAYNIVLWHVSYMLLYYCRLLCSAQEAHDTIILDNSMSYIRWNPKGGVVNLYTVYGFPQFA